MLTSEGKMLRLVMMPLVTLLTAWACTAKEWTPGSEPSGGYITYPRDGDVFACGAPVTCECLGGSDYDRWTDDAACPPTGEELDEMSLNHPLWVASHGSFKDGDNIGHTVVWIAPGSATSGISFQYYHDDRPKDIPWYESGTRDDVSTDPSGFLQDTVSGVEAIVPDVNQVWLGCWVGQSHMKHDINDVNLPEYNRNPPNNDPASYTMTARAYATVRFWHAKTLDQIVDVNVCGVTVNDGNNIGSWDASLMVSRWQTNWQTSQASGCIATDSINDSIQRCTYDTYWYYWCPDGLLAWIPTTVVQNSELFVVYGGPKCDSNDYTTNHLRHATTWASGGQKVTEDDIPHKIQENCWLRFAYTRLDDPWDLETQQGDCDTHARLVAEALKVLGVNADGSPRVGETRWCSTHGMSEYHYLIAVSGAATNFEGVCQVNLVDEATPWSCYYDKAMGPVNGDYQKGTQANMWNEWNNYPPPHHKVIHHYTYWENHP